MSKINFDKYIYIYIYSVQKLKTNVPPSICDLPEKHEGINLLFKGQRIEDFAPYTIDLTSKSQQVIKQYFSN